MSRHSEEIGDFRTADFSQDDANHGAYTQFHDLVYRPGQDQGSSGFWQGPNGGAGPSPEIALLYRELKEQGQVDPETMAALRFLDDRLSQNQMGGNIPLDANGRPIAYAFADAGAQAINDQGAQAMPADATQLQPADATQLQPTDTSQSQLQSVQALWAAAHGMDANDPQSYQAIQPGADGQTLAVGPYQLDANIMGQWFAQATDQNGQISKDAINQLVSAGRISQQTADAVTSPEFMTFMNSLASGQQPAPEQVAQFLAPDLQNAIASDMVAAMQSKLSETGQQASPGTLIASLDSRTPLTQADLQNPNIAQFVQSIDAAAGGTASSDQQLIQPQITTTDGYSTIQTDNTTVSQEPATDPSQIDNGPITIASDPTVTVDQSGG